MKMISPMYDFVFKAMFGREDKTSKKLLIGLLNDILSSKGEDPICSVTYLNPFKGMIEVLTPLLSVCSRVK